MRNLGDRISELEARLKQLKARQQQIEIRRKRLEVQQARKEDTRRKILVGAVVLTKVERGEIGEGQLRKWLTEGLTRAEDRALFRL